MGSGFSLTPLDSDVLSAKVKPTVSVCWGSL